MCYPKPTDRALYNGLVVQCKSLGIPFVTVEEVLDSSTAPLAQRYDVVLDALFGFSFKVRAAPAPLRRPSTTRHGTRGQRRLPQGTSLTTTTGGGGGSGLGLGLGLGLG